MKTEFAKVVIELKVLAVVSVFIYLSQLVVDNFLLLWIDNVFIK